VPFRCDGTAKIADAAIAEIRPGQGGEGGEIVDIGMPSATTIEPGLGLRVKRVGRTSGVNKGRVVAVDVSVNVDYSDCFDGSKIAVMAGAFLVQPGSFLKGGDSGALVVENADACPRPVGLAFASSSQVAAASPINEVLAALNVSMVGCGPSATAGASVPDDLDAAIAAKRNAEGALLTIKGVTGVGVGGRSVIHIYVEKGTAELRRLLPQQLDGIAVRIIETGKLRAL